jgi:hypothetical protein
MPRRANWHEQRRGFSVSEEAAQAIKADEAQQQKAAHDQVADDRREIRRARESSAP